MSGAGEDERGPAVGRVEAFSDGVIAIIITIMVLELHAPAAAGAAPLLALWPVALAYLLSYVYVAIYWVNHHRLFSHATRVTNGLIWWNIALLFALSLVPFSTSYLGEHRFSRAATALYLVTMLFPAISYTGLQRVIQRSGDQSPDARPYHRATVRKGLVATGLYAGGLALTALSPWLGIGAAAVVAVLWFLPHGPVDALFAGPRGSARPDGQRDGPA